MQTRSFGPGKKKKKKSLLIDRGTSVADEVRIYIESCLSEAPSLQEQDGKRER